MIQGGEHHSVAVMEDGSVWAWGRNDEGELGVVIGEEGEEKKKARFTGIPRKVEDIAKVKIE